jgi:hypothetical protein
MMGTWYFLLCNSDDWSCHKLLEKLKKSLPILTLDFVEGKGFLLKIGTNAKSLDGSTGENG